MHFWRVTKYDPRRRDRRGRFRDETWTSVSDIGRAFAGETLTPAAYMAVEDAYVAALTAFVRAAGNPPLTVVGLEPSTPRSPGAQSLQSVERPELREGTILPSSDLDAVIRLILREELWCELRYAARLRIRFGWDYYAYVASDSPSQEGVARAEELGLFVEPLERLPEERPQGNEFRGEEPR
jgi:hypothetical protein